MARLDRQTLHLINYQFRQVVRDDGHVASVTNERRAHQGFGCKTVFAAPTAESNCSPISAKAARWLIPPVPWAITLDVVVWLPRAQIQKLFGLQARRSSRVSLTTITNETLREAKPLARLALLSGGCRLVQKAAFDADAHHRQTRLTHSEQGGHSQRFGGQDRTLRALVSICRASALRWLWAHRRHAQPKFRTRSSSRRELRGSGSLSGSVRIDRVLARPPPPRTRNDSRDAACSSLRGALATKRSRLPLRGGWIAWLRLQ
ncbi:hypothetical protein ACVME9_000187 [Bradyrhizobium liaoningense]